MLPNKPMLDLRERPSRQGAPGRNPLMWLAGRGGDVLEIRIIVQDHRAIVLCYRSGQQVDHANGLVVTTGRHPNWTSRARSAITSLTGRTT